MIPIDQLDFGDLVALPWCAGRVVKRARHVVTLEVLTADYPEDVGTEVDIYWDSGLVHTMRRISEDELTLLALSMV